MDTNSDFDPMAVGQTQTPPAAITTGPEIADEIRKLQSRADAFRDVADRFYLLWWNLPRTTLRQADQDIQDLFRMFMDLAPSFGVSRNGVPELRECCGRKRTWKDDPLNGKDDVLVMAPARDEDPALGWCPGDVLRRITRFFGAKYCEKCDRRRRRINAFFRCGGA